MTSITRVHEVAAALIDALRDDAAAGRGDVVREHVPRRRRTPAGGPVGTAIVGLFCDDPPSRSLFHRLGFDEVWHFYGGDPIRLVLLHPDGESGEVILGSDVLAGQRVQYPIPAGTWQAGELVPGGEWACTGARWHRGSRAACFEGGAVAELLGAGYPGRDDDIRRLGVPDDHETTMPAGFAG